ncbi:MAG: hypothetical protein M0Z78_08695 [Betaproteobacteria bacterium]|nr:hypothetical protein [Betaproteobacteria bacterium]
MLPPELLNINELSNIIASTSPVDDHATLLAALNSRYPTTPFKILQEYDGRTWDVGVIDSTGNRVTDKLGQWIDQEIAAAGGTAQEVWRRHKEAGLIRTERVGSCLYLVAPYGPDPDQFYQLEILVGPEMTTQKLFDPDPYFPVEDRQDLLSGPPLIFSDNERQELAPSVYKFERLTNMRRFLRDLVDTYKANRLAQIPVLEKKSIRVQEIVLGPDGWQSNNEVPFLDLAPGWIDRTPPALRLFQDWAESSAGQGGEKICNHWWMQVGEWKDKGQKQYALTPQWAEADGGLNLPEIMPDWEASPYGVMESLSQFDKQAGYPFAWYFYMLHGNRVGHSAGGVIANAIKSGLLNLPKCDEEVLLRWRDDQYGF